MLTHSLLFLAAAQAVIAAPLEGKRDIPDNTLPAGTNPIKIASVSWLGYQTADNSCSKRDLGFTGKIAGKWYSIFGDTLWCSSGVTNPLADTDGFHGMVRDSVSLLGTNPLKVHDLNLNTDTPVPHQLQFVPYNSAWGETNLYGFGGTSLCETDSGSATGALYYLVNANDAGLVGAGVAKIQVQSGTPTVTQRYGSTGWWWDVKTTARWGDIAAYRDDNSNYIYILGGPPTSVTDSGQAQYIYQARVKASNAFDLSKYQYWWGRAKGWNSTMPTTSNFGAFTTETAVMWGAGQGQIVWSPYYSVYIYVHIGFLDSTLWLRTAPAPEGPWSADVKVYTATPINGGLVYAGVAYPHLDSTGQTLTVGYTNNNHIEVLKVAFTK